MRRVFSDAGYAVNREYDEGVIELRFDIRPTEKSLDVMYSRERRAEARSIERMLSPRSVAVLGASTDTLTVGHAVLANLLAGAFTGPVYPIHPDGIAVQGVPSYRAMADVAAPVDLAVVADIDADVAALIRRCQGGRRARPGGGRRRAGGAAAPVTGNSWPPPGPTGCGCSGRTAWA